MMKRSLALALCLCLALSLMTAAFAADAGQFSDRTEAEGAVMYGSFNATHSYIITESITESSAELLTNETTWTVGGGTVTYTPNGNDYTLTITNVKESGLSICLNTASGGSNITVNAIDSTIGTLYSEDNGNATVTLKGDLTVSAIQAHLDDDDANNAGVEKKLTVDNEAKLTISSAQTSNIDNLYLEPCSSFATEGTATVNVYKDFKGRTVFDQVDGFDISTRSLLTVGEGTTLVFDGDKAYLQTDGNVVLHGTIKVCNNYISETKLYGGVTIGPKGKFYNVELDETEMEYICTGTPPSFAPVRDGYIAIGAVEYAKRGEYTGQLDDKTLYTAGSGHIRRNGSTVILDNATLTHPLTLPDGDMELHLVRDTTSTITVSDDTALSAPGSLTIKSTEHGYSSGVLRIISPDNSPNTGIDVTGGLTIDDASVTVGYYSNDPGVAQDINPAYAVKAASLKVTNGGGLSAYATKQCIHITGDIKVSGVGSLINAHYAAPYNQTAATIQANSLAVESGAGVGAYWGGIAVTGNVGVTGEGSFISAGNEKGPGIVAKEVSVTKGAHLERVKGTTGIKADTVTVDSTQDTSGTLSLIWGTDGPAIQAKEATLGAKDTVVIVAGPPAGVVADKVPVTGALSADENKTFTKTYPEGKGKGVAVLSDKVEIEAGYINFTPTITLEYTEHTCTGRPLEPTVTVMDGERVIDPQYYTVSYENNIDNLNNQPAKVTVTATNGYWFDPIGEPANEAETEDNHNTPYTFEFKIIGTPPVGGGTGASIQSPKTFDAGIAVYGAMALASAAGAVYVSKKHH